MSLDLTVSKIIDLDFRVEHYSNVWSELDPIFNAHYHEIEPLADKIPLSVNHESYCMIDADGGLLLVTARDNGQIVGYILNFISYSLHNKDTLTSTNDAIYVSPEYRGNGVFKRMMELLEDELKKRGVEYLVMSVKTRFNVGNYLETLGFNEVERNYEKYLGV